MTYKPTIGLEIHAELKTKTKMFCNSLNDPDEKEPNVNVCPICMGHPGTLPVINKEAVRHVLRVGSAVGGTLADFTEFDRKNYFYPDIPKGYQISQYEHPLVSGGELSGVALTRIHLEEDTASSKHKGDHSIVDFNRAGVPLMELVTEPVITSAEEAGKFARELQLLLRTLGVSDANMEKGEMRVEANISISKTDIFGTKVEVKNLNSFKIVEQAIIYELKRQEEVLEKGGEILQETRGWDESKGETFSQRLKEGSEDYRYFPDPDLPKLKLSELEEFGGVALEESLPELPWERRTRYQEHFGLKEEDANMFVRDAYLGTLFDEIVEERADNKSFVKLATNYIATDLAALLRDTEENKLTATAFKDLIDMTAEGEISSSAVKVVLPVLVEEGGDPKAIVEEKGLVQQSDEGALKELAEKIMEANEQAVSEYKSGKESSLQYLVGQAMKESRGSANPQMLQKIFTDLLA